MKTSIVKVTPAMALEWLAMNKGNRRLRRLHIRQLADAMLRGEWVLTPDGIAFDVNGTLINGQHRLHAIVLSGMTIEMNVTTGVPEKAFKVIDQGVKRTTGDLLRLDSRVAQPLRRGASITLGFGSPTAAQIEAVGSSGLLESIVRVVDYCGTQARYFSSSTMCLSAAVSLMMGHPAEFVLGQYAALVLMHFDDMTEHSKALTRQVARMSRNGSTGTSEELARGLRVFDPAKAKSTRVVVDDAGIAEAPAKVRSVIRECMAKRGIQLPSKEAP